MVKGSAWSEERTRSPSAIPDEGVREFLEDKTAHLFATQLQTRLRSLEQTRDIPKFLRRNSYSLYLEGHFALLDPRDLERTTLSPTPPSSSDYTSLEQSPEPNSKTHRYPVYPLERALPRSRTLQGRIDRRSQPQSKKAGNTLSKKKHNMLRRSKMKENGLFYELDWIGRNTVTVCQMQEKSPEMCTKKG